MPSDLYIPAVTLTAPSGVDGHGEIAVLNDPTSAHFVGYVEDHSWGLESRQPIDNRPEAHGGRFGSFYYGPRTMSMRVRLMFGASLAASNARADKLLAAFDAMAADGSMVWTEAGRVATHYAYRSQGLPAGPDAEGIVLLQATSEESLILANVASSASPGAGLSNAGKHATFPVISFNAPASGTVTLSRTSPSPTETLSLTVGGATGLVASVGTVVDFAARTVIQGSQPNPDKRSAVVFPTSIWWAMAPGANTISAGGSPTSVTVQWRSAWLA